ncbi:MAG: hypothetical protein AB7T63_10035 [Planctomycetota bacterium]
MSDSPAPAPTPAAPAPTNMHPRVIVRAYPKVVFFWLTWIVSLVAAILEKNNPGGAVHLGTIWMAVFAFNMMVIAFDFTEVISLLLLATIAVVVFAGLYFDFLGPIGDWVVNLKLNMDSTFYFTMFGLFTIIYLFVFVKTRFDYWEFRHNEVIHRRGVFADLKRYSTEDLRWFKEIPDVLERVLCGSGRMILTTPREQQPIVIEHVLGISRIDEKVADILGIKRVTMG